MREYAGQKFMTVIMLASFLLLGCGIFLIWVSLPDTGAFSLPEQGLVLENAKIAQTIHYAKCGHEVSRRIDVFPEWVGMNQARVTESAPENWRIHSFSPALIEASCSENLFCPDHWVLTLGDGGAPGIYHNQYGFSMAKYGDASLGTIDEDTRESLVHGIAFGSREELEQWMTSFRQNSQKEPLPDAIIQ